MAEAKKTTTAKTSPTKDVEAQIRALALRVTALEEDKKTCHKAFVEGIELEGFEKKVQKWLSENTLLKVAGLIVLGIVLFTIIF